jgi:hypothetical protein
MFRQRKYLIICLLIIGTLLFLLFGSYNYLGYTRLVNPSILVVEGWLPEEVLQAARAEFLNRDYKLLITTGFPYVHGCRMGSWGRMVFNLGHTEVHSDSVIKVSVTLRGTRAKGEFAHFVVSADSTVLGEDFSSHRTKTYSYRLEKGPYPRTITVEYDNDAYTRLRDRDLYVYSVSVNNTHYPANDTHVTWFERRSGKYYFIKKLSNSIATDAAAFLELAGIRDSLVVPVESNEKIKSKTYTTALDVKKWLSENKQEGDRSITIFTQGMHARRSYASFRKAFGRDFNIGVISSPDARINRFNWWKSARGWKRMLYEFAGLLYVAVFI